MRAIQLTPRQRRTEIQQQLMQLRQDAPRLRVFAGAGDADDAHDSDIDRLCKALVDLGPVFAGFGRYLATRTDLLPRTDCRNLAKIDEALAPLSAGAVRKIVRDELANREVSSESPAALESLEDDPFDLRWSFQRHYGRLTNGDSVVVRVAKPCSSSEIDLDALDLLRPFVVPRMPDDESFVQCVQDFCRHYAAEIDGLRLADALDSIRAEAQDGESFLVPRIYRDLSTRRVLILERLPGQRLNDWMVQNLKSEHAARSHEELPETTGSHHGLSGELARLICEAWLRQAFDGGLLAVDVCPRNLVVLAPPQISIDEGVFSPVPQQARDNLLKYLIAVAIDEPSLALDCLLNECEGTRRKVPVDEMDRLFRQLVPDRTDEESTCNSGPLLAATVLAQWKTAVDRGYRPLRQVAPALLGIIALADTVRPMAPQRDSLLNGLKDFRIARMIREFHGIVDPMFWFGRVDRIMAVMISAPKRFNDVLSAMGSETPRQQHVVRREGRSQTGLPAWVMPALLLAFLLLFADTNTTSALASEWKEPLSAFLFLILGGLLLKAIAAPSR